MPDATGKFSSAETAEIATVINSKVKDPSDPCPNCGQTPSLIVEYVSRFEMAHVPSQNDRASRVIPTVATVCSHCSFIRQFAVQEMGLSFPVPAWIESSRPADEDVTNG